ncbi:MAG: hypothetical protein K8R19_04060 [Methanosarcinales archaeon]|nr:hypothetical protein [Methanosarcinales archaeon]
MRSKKNYFLFKSTGNSDYYELSENELLEAKDIFSENNYPELARLTVKDKIVNYPYSPLIDDEYIILLNGIRIKGLEYPKRIETSEIGIIKFTYKYYFNIPPKGFPMFKFCIENGNYCSNWIKIKDNEFRDVKIMIQSDSPKKIKGDIFIYGEDKPDIPLGNVKDYYFADFLPDFDIINNTPSFIFRQDKPYETIDLTIEKSLLEKLKDISAITGVTIFIVISLIISGIKWGIKHFRSKKTIH